MKIDMILHTIGKRLVRNVRTLSPSRANSQYVPCGLRTMYFLLMFTIGIGTAWGQTDITDITSLSSITDMAGHYRITSDVSGSGHTTITGPFTGILEAAIDPQTHMPYKITNLSAPLFTTLTGTVKNLVLEDVNISQSGQVGAVACTATGAARIYNVGILSGSVGSTGTSTASNATDCCGGLVGLLDGNSNESNAPRVVNCYSYANITGGNRVGGIVGYNNYTSNASNIRSIVMNCMFYGDITKGSNVAPVFGGNLIDNRQDKQSLNTFNFYAYDKLKTKEINSYNSTLAIEERFLTRFEFYRLLLNSNKKLAAWYATGNVADANQMLKWVLETADRTIRTPKPYPILKAQGSYPSIINYDCNNAPDSASIGRNKGGKLGKTLSVTIYTKSQKTTGGQSWPTATTCDVQTTSLTLVRTDMDAERFNFNYDKVQLPYYNDVGTGNYTEGRVVTGWKIVSMKNGTEGTYAASDLWGGYNFADRYCTKKDIYSVSGRVFSQGAYFDVPYGVTAITIEPYWGFASFVADERYDVVYNNSYGNKTGVPAMGKQVDSWTFNGVSVKTDINSAFGTITTKGTTVYDNAVVLVGNFHQANINTSPFKDSTPFTLMSVDLDNDKEPDYSLIYHDNNRSAVCPIRFDFLNIIGTAQAQKPYSSSTVLNASVFNAKAWFEITNTCLIYFSQFEYENSGKTAGKSPIILLGGVYDQFTSTKVNEVKNTTYLHVGGNAWFNDFGNGTHSDGSKSTKHIPISVTGGEYRGFYLTGTYNQSAAMLNDDAECYISGGHFGEAAGAGQEQIGGNVHWQIYNADIDNFYGGGVNHAKPILGTVTVDIMYSHVGTYCGGPKFGNMSTGKAVKTNATGCTFGTYFGAGYGGTSYSRVKYRDEADNMDFNSWQNLYATSSGDRGKYYDGTSTFANGSHQDYGKKGLGVAVDFDYEFFVWTSGKTGGRFFVKFASFSLAQCDDVESKLKKCIIENNYYGGGSLGKVAGTVTSELEDCTVKGNVFGAGFSASLPTLQVRDAGFESDGNGGYKIPSFNKYSGMFQPGVPAKPTSTDMSGTTEFQWIKEDNYPSNGLVGFVNDQNSYNIDGRYVVTTTDISNTNLGSVGSAILTLTGNTKVSGNVYGGGDQSTINGTGTLGNTIVTLKDNTQVTGDVYGGGNVANVSGATKVILLGGQVNHDVYGGGRGRLEEGTEGEEGYVSPIAATVGDATVYLNGMEQADYEANSDNYSSVVELNAENTAYTVPNGNLGCVVKGNIFGCNNLNGTPKGAVIVHIYKTQNAITESISKKVEIGDLGTPGESENAIEYWKTKAQENGVSSDDINNALALEGNDAKIAALRTATEAVYINNNQYDVRAVYGGGNLAAYEPTNSDLEYNETNKAKLDALHTTVIIDGCNLTSIRQVYGGGNAASTPATSVTVNGTYEIEELFGGGNGKDALPDGSENPGANVGFYDYSAEEDTYNTKEKRTTDAELAPTFIEKYVYGSGKASVDIYGGKIHRVFGGSNTKGNVRITAVTMLEERKDGEDAICDFQVDEAYGGGKSAPMDAEAKLLMACIPGLKAAYGGAQAADVQNNVVLNITNGTFERVFGGNNESGTIRGSITVNIEETGCQPLIIGELYGGGNLAPYSVYGYDTDGKPIESATAKVYADPQINVKSFTSIGDIYGGGYGGPAIMYGDPRVNINVAEGKFKDYVGDLNKYGTDYMYDANGYKGNTIPFDDHSVILPPHLKGKIGAIQNVFGGGNAAAVVGSTSVNVGTTSWEYVTISDVDIEVGVTDVSTFYTRNSDGTYSLAEGTAGEGKTYYQKCEVKGADIKGNVYGGGNKANVTGSANVTIGKKQE